MDSELTEIDRNCRFRLFSVTEINRSPYRGVGFRLFLSVRVSMPDLFGLEQQPQRSNDGPDGATVTKVITVLNPHLADSLFLVDAWQEERGGHRPGTETCGDGLNFSTKQ